MWVVVAAVAWLAVGGNAFRIKASLGDQQVAEIDITATTDPHEFATAWCKEHGYSNPQTRNALAELIHTEQMKRIEKQRSFSFDPKTALPVLVVGAALSKRGVGHLPTTTMVLLGILFAVYYNRTPIPFLPHRDNACLSAHALFVAGQVHRVVVSLLYHGPPMHLAGNALSLLSHGSILEPALGAGRFLRVFAFLAVASNILMCAVNTVLGMPMHQCYIGISNALFATKVLVQQHSPDEFRTVLGLVKVPRLYVLPAELAIAHLLLPQTALVGHLCGCLVGFLWVDGYLQVGL